MDSYYPTIESTFVKSVVYKGVEYDCHIIDTAGQVKAFYHWQYVAFNLTTYVAK